MTWTTSPRIARLAARTRFGLPALVSLLLGHDAVYAAEHGLGDGFSNAMTPLGHDAYRAAFTLAAAVAAVGLTLGSAVMVARLRIQLRRGRTGALTAPAGGFGGTVLVAAA